MSKNKSIQISIIIPTYNRSVVLEKAIKSMLVQTYTNFEVIVVDNGRSSDDTEKVVQNISNKDSRVSFYSIEEKGCIFARNYGADKAKGEILLTTDDDIELIDPNTLKELTDTFKNQQIGIVGSIESPTKKFHIEKIKKKDNASKIGVIEQNGVFHANYDQLFGQKTTVVDHVRSAFMAIRKNVFYKAGMFQEFYNANGMGFRYESDLCMQVKSLGYDVVVNPKIIVWHKGAVRSRGFKRGRGLSFYYYANRNHMVFMLRHYWEKDILKWLWREFIIGTHRTPGIHYCWLMIKTKRDMRWLQYMVVSFWGKIVGILKYILL